MQHAVRSSFWKDLGRSCEAAAGENKFLEGFGVRSRG